MQRDRNTLGAALMLHGTAAYTGFVVAATVETEATAWPVLTTGGVHLCVDALRHDSATGVHMTNTSSDAFSIGARFCSAVRKILSK